jgi:Fe-S-cluster containining protein
MARSVSKPRKRDRKQTNGRTRAKGNGHANGNGHVNGNGRAPLPANGARKLPIVTEPTQSHVPCLSCGLCCGYIAVDIEEPTTLKGATDILWYLYHPNVSVYAEDDDWMVVFETRCQHQLDDKRCSIYETRPQICRAFDENECEVNSEEIGVSFYTPREFLEYLERNHKRIHTLVRKRYMPPESSLDGRAVPQSNFGPIRPRLLALRAGRAASAAR